MRSRTRSSLFPFLSSNAVQPAHMVFLWRPHVISQGKEGIPRRPPRDCLGIMKFGLFIARQYILYKEKEKSWRIRPAACCRGVWSKMTKDGSFSSSRCSWGCSPRTRGGCKTAWPRCGRLGHTPASAPAGQGPRRLGSGKGAGCNRGST